MKLIKIPALLLILLMLACQMMGQTTREAIYQNIAQTGGVYYAYPTKEVVSTPAPKGYKPFYISHYARHGSRWLISDKEYTDVINIFEKAHQANALTALGEDVRSRLSIIWKDAEGREGELSPVGVQQHRGIAERMYQNYPEVFKDRPEISARATVVVRCVLSMDAFCERLKELNPAMQITRESGKRYMDYLCGYTLEANQFKSHGGPWYEEYRKFEESHVHPERLVNALFNSKEYIYRNVNPRQLMWGLYAIASDLQNTELDLTLYDIFQKEELFDMWQIGNYHNYVCYGPAPISQGLIIATAKLLLTNILDSADEAIRSGKKSATFRFGHDGNITPLIGLMQLSGGNGQETNPDKFYQAWCNFQVSPMAANVQLIFFSKKGSEDILVKFLHNEKEVAIPVKTDLAPFYRWKDVEEYYRAVINKLP